MTALIIGALALALFQFWLLPATLNIKNLSYMLSSRDNQIESSVLQDRVSRAGGNLQESLPAFLALALLATIQQVDLVQAAIIWLGLRVLYIPCYMLNIIYVRTLIWIGSLGCLIYMASKLI